MAESEVKQAVGLIAGLNKFLRAAFVHWNIHRKLAIMVVRKRVKSYPNFAQIVDAGNPSGVRTTLAERWQEHGRQDRDNGYDAEQFEQGEPQGRVSWPVAVHSLPIHKHYRCRG